MPNVLTIYNSGTDFDESSDDLIPVLAHRTVGARGSDWELNPGPGSTGQLKRDRPGYQVFARWADPELSLPVSALFSALQLREDLAGKVVGSGLGHGMQMSALHTVELAQRVKPKTINFVGWSRGAVTSIITANLLAKKSVGARVNLLLFDPVIGDPALNSSIWSSINTQSLGSNVGEAIVLQQIDELRWIMQAHQISKVHGAARVRFLPLPGEHSFAVQPQSGEHGAKYEPVFGIAWGMSLEFLARHGTLISGSRLFTPAKFCELYSRLWLNTLGHKSNPNNNRPTTIRKVSASIFNSHHYEVLNATVPRNTVAIAQLLSQNMSTLHPDLARAAIAEIDLAARRRDIPHTLEYLRLHRQILVFGLEFGHGPRGGAQSTVGHLQTTGPTIGPARVR